MSLLAIAALQTFTALHAFWARDLPTMQAALEEVTPEDSPHLHPLLEDLFALSTCAPLPPLGADVDEEARRLLIRAEAARRVRLGADADRSATLWRQLLSARFFRHAPPPREGPVWRWPLEQERWPGEAIAPREVPACDAAVGPPAPGPELPAQSSEAALLDAALEQRVGLSSPTRQRLLFHRAVLALRANDLQTSTRRAAALDPSALPPELGVEARLLRLELGVDPPEGFLAIAPGDAPPALRLPLRVRRLEQQDSQRAWDAVIAEGAELEPLVPGELRPLIRLRRVQALLARHRTDEALELTLSAGAGSAGLIELRLRALADVPRSDAAALLAQGGRLDDARLLEIGRAALARGNRVTAAALAQAQGRLPPTFVQLLLQVELAAADASTPPLREAIAQLRERLGEGPLSSGREKPVLELAQRLVAAHAGAPRPHRALLRSQLTTLRPLLGESGARAFDRVLGPLEAKASPTGAVALGEIAVATTPAPVERAPLTWSFSEPYSLLELPTPEGAVRDWFDPSTAEQADAR